MRLNCWSCWLVYQQMILLGSQDIGGAVVDSILRCQDIGWWLGYLLRCCLFCPVLPG
jgi:hypothetical protein